MPKGGNNNQNLKPVRTTAEARERGKKGGKASGEARAKKKTARELLEMLDALPVVGDSKDTLVAFGIPDNEQNQQTLRLVGLHKKAASGDAAANRLLLDIKGEAPTQTVKVETNDETREAYENAAAAIKKKRG